MKWTPKIGKGVFVAGGDQHQIKRPRLGGGAHEVALAHEPVIDPGKTGRSPAHALSAEDSFLEVHRAWGFRPSGPAHELPNDWPSRRCPLRKTDARDAR